MTKRCEILGKRSNQELKKSKTKLEMIDGTKLIGIEF